MAIEWKPEYEEWVDLTARPTLSGEYPRLAWVSAATAVMNDEQPVVHELSRMRTPTLRVIGQEDRTTRGRGQIPPEVLAPLGNYPARGRKAAQAFRSAKLVELEGVGHIPHLEAKGRFHRVLVDLLGS